MKLGKWIGGGIGWAFFGPIGGIIGFFAGSILDTDANIKYSSIKTKQGDFIISLLVLIAAVMKADGKIMKSELNYTKKFLIQNFGQEKTKEALSILKELLKKEIPVIEVATQIGQNLNYESKLQLLDFLYGIAATDGSINENEKKIITLIYTYFGISQKDAESINAMYIKSTTSAYNILEIDKNSNIEEIKKAYREMAKKHHPDKVAYLGEDIQKAAQEKFKKINMAYESIKKEKGF